MASFSAWQKQKKEEESRAALEQAAREMYTKEAGAWAASQPAQTSQSAAMPDWYKQDAAQAARAAEEKQAATALSAAAQAYQKEASDWQKSQGSRVVTASQAAAAATGAKDAAEPKGFSAWQKENRPEAYARSRSGYLSTAGDWEDEVKGLSQRLTKEYGTDRGADYLQKTGGMIDSLISRGQSYASALAESGNREGTRYAEDLTRYLGDLRSAFDSEDSYEDWQLGQRLWKYEDIESQPDYEQNSRYEPTGVATGRDRKQGILSSLGTPSTEGYDQLYYEAINGDRQALADLNAIDLAYKGSNGGIWTMDWLPVDKIETLDEAEKKRYNYLYKTEGPEAAKRYLADLKGDVNARARENYQKDLRQTARDDWFGSSLATVVTSPLKAAGYINQLYDFSDDGSMDQNAGYNKVSMASGAVRDEVSKMAEENWGKVGSFAYQTGMSMGDFLFNAAITGGSEALSLAIMGASAAADTVLNLKDQGLSDGRAFTLGSIAGAIEIITEKIGWDALFKADKLGMNYLKYVINNTLSEGFEEATSDVLNWLVDGIADAVTGTSESEWKREMQRLQTEPDPETGKTLSYDEAKRKVISERLTELGMDFAGGALSGLIMGGVGGAFGRGGNYVSFSRMGKQYAGAQNLENRNALMEAARSSIEGTTAYDVLQQLETKQAKGRQLSAEDMGRLYYANELAREQSGKAESLLQQAAEEMTRNGKPDGETADAIAANPYALRELGVDTGLSERQQRQAVREAMQERYSQEEKERTEAFEAKPEETINARVKETAQPTTSTATKADIEAQLSRETGIRSQAQQEAQSRAKALGIEEYGASAYAAMQEEGASLAEFIAYWNAGRNGTAFNNVSTPYSGSMDVAQQAIAYNTGRLDSIKSEAQTETDQKSQLAQARARRAAANPNAGMSRENARAYDLKNSEYRLMDAYGRVTGYTVEMVDSITAANGQGSNGRIVGNTIQIAKNSSDPYLVATLHEIVHSIRDVDPEAYKLLADFVARNQSPEQRAWNEARLSKGYEGLGADIEEESVANAFSRMVKSDRQMLNKMAQEQPNVIRRIIEAVEDLITEIKRRMAHDRKTLTKYQLDAYSDLQSKADEMRVTLQTALSNARETVRQAGEQGKEQTQYETNGGKAAPASIDPDFAGARHSITVPYIRRTKAYDAFIKGLSAEARQTLDLFSAVHEAGELHPISIDGAEAANITKKYMTASKWNELCKASKEFSDTAKELASLIPEDVKKNAHINADGTISETAFEQEFKMERAYIQRIVDALPKEVVSSTVTTDGRRVKVSDKDKVSSIGGEAYRRALVEERRKLYAEGRLPTKAIGGLGKDSWGAMGFLATNEKTGASGDFITLCPQMYFNRGCFYCYRRAALTSGVNNKLTGETVWYTGEVLQLKQKDIDALNKKGGLRIQSFGDWMEQYSSQLADLLIDAEKVGLQIKIITKEPSMIDTVAVLKGQGIGKSLYFNLSADYTIEEQGTINNADSGGALPSNPLRPYMHTSDGRNFWKRALTVEEANEYRKKYPWVNTRIVATTVEEFLEGLRSPMVDVVTGYHGNIRQFERISSATGKTLVEVEPLGDAGMPRFAFESGKWVMEYAGKTKTHQTLAKAIEKAGLQYQYYIKSCCITGRCATCEGKCGQLARDFNVKNATNADKQSVAYWQKEMTSAADNPLLLDQMDDAQAEALLKAEMESRNEGERFSLKSSVEETKNLIALHNLNATKLAKALDLGGFPMPSIAVTKTDIPHTNFGDITLVMNRSTIDPQADRRNTVYSADAWTPTFPQIEYEADEKAEKRLRDKYYELSRKFGREAANPLYAWGNYAEDELTRRGGPEAVIEDALDDTDMMKLYLLDTGLEVPGPVTEEKVSRLDDATIAFYDTFAEGLGKDTFEELNVRDGETIPGARKRWWADHGEEFENVYREYMASLGFSTDEVNNVLENESIASQTKKALQIRNYLRTGPETRTTTTNVKATKEAIRAAVDSEKYESWLHGLFDGLVKRSGVYNGKDRYTRSGDSRSFTSTHYEATLENIAKAMASQNNGNSRNVSGFYGVKSLRAGMAKRFSSIKQMHEYEGRLQHLTQEEADSINDALGKRLADLLTRIYNKSPHRSSDSNYFMDMDSLGNILMEATEEQTVSVDSVEKVFSRYGYSLGNALATDVRDLLFDVSQMPVNIFEAKPERAVRFNEVLAAVVPTGTDKELRDRLSAAGVGSVLEYEKGNDADRMAKANSVEGARFSLKVIETLSESDVRKELQQCVSGNYNRDSYIPLRRNTPRLLKYWVEKDSGGRRTVPEAPIAMQVRHVQQTMEELGEEQENYGKSRPHGISEDGMIAIIKKMDDPSYIVFQKNGRYAEIVSYYDKNGQKGLISFDFGDFRYEQYLNGYPKGVYNTVATIFNPDDLKAYLNDSRNRIIYKKEKGEQQQVGSGSIVPFTHADSPFYEPTIAPPSTEVKTNYSLNEKQQKNYDYNERQTETGSTLKTLNGSQIKRSKYGVGKDIGGTIYFHRDYAADVIPAEVYEAALQTLQENYPDFQFNCVEYNPKDNTVRFDEASGFDTEREPVVGDFVRVNADGTTKQGHTDYIWHHKWLWVKDDYSGFDVKDSWEWSRQWLNTISGKTYDINGKQYNDRGTSDGNGIGRWNTQLDAYGLPRDGQTRYSIKGLDRNGGADSEGNEYEFTEMPKYQDHTSAGTSLPKNAPTVYKAIKWQPGTKNLDIGGGKTEFANELLKQYGAENKLMDPYNRDAEYNLEAIRSLIMDGKYDTVTCANVLNVIDSAQSRRNVILEAAKALKPDGTAYFQIYEGDKKSGGKETSKGYQENRKTGTYIEEVQQWFNDVTQWDYNTKSGSFKPSKSGNIIVAKDPKANLPKAYWEYEEGKAVKYSLSDKEQLEQWVEQYGEIPKGEKPSRDVTMPKRTAENLKLSQTVRTVLEGDVTPDTMVPTIEHLVTQDEYSYTPYADKAAINEANAYIGKKGYAAALAGWTQEIQSGRVSKTNTATGWALYNNAANAGDTKTAITVLQMMVGHQRNAAQAVQATRILKKLSPTAQLYAAVRSVEDINEELKKKYGDKAPEVEVSPDLAEAYIAAKTDEQRGEVMKEIYRNVGKQMPSTFVDRWNAWRYLAMLGNPRTHVRNIAGNLGFAPVVAAKDVLATGIESAVYYASGKRMNRTKGNILGTKTGAQLMKAAWADYDLMKEVALGEQKYEDLTSNAGPNEGKYIQEGRRIFGNTRSKAWNKTGGAALEGARRFNSKALDVEDVWFSRPHYALAMAQFCAANKITPQQIASGKGLEAARRYAVREAQKATYRDANAFSDAVAQLARGQAWNKNWATRAVRTLAEGVLPFRKTPANILMRGLEYSPLGILKSVSYDLYKVSNKEMTGADMIDDLAAGLTGTGLLALGAYLAAQGLIRGRGKEDDKEKKLSEQQGHQSYALELPDGTSITLDWLAPECLPLFVGVNLAEEATATLERDVTLSDVFAAIGNVTEPLLKMSCLQSLNDILESRQYAKSNDDVNALVATMSSAATSYLTQAFPTLLGQAERTVEDKRYSTYTSKNAFLTSDMQYTLGKISGKVPVWEYGQVPYIDAWGREELSGAPAVRIVNNFINPAYVKKISQTDVEDELTRLYKATGEGSLIPQRASKSLTWNNETKYLTADEYVQYATAKGQGSLQYVSSVIKSAGYKAASDDVKADMISDAYTFADRLAQEAFGRKIEDGWLAEAREGLKKGISLGDYLTAKNLTKDLESIKDAEGKSIANSLGLQKMAAINSISGLSDEKRRYLYECMDVGKDVISKNPAAVKQQLDAINQIQQVAPKGGITELAQAVQNGNTAKQKQLQNLLLKSGLYTESSLKTAVESQMKKDAGVKSVSELDTRYYSDPEEQKKYTEYTNAAKNSPLWKDAGDKVHERTNTLISGMLSGSEQYAAQVEKAQSGASVGLSETDWILYKTALYMADEATGGNNSYTNAEVEEAIRSLGDLTDDQRRYLWTAQGKKASSYPF